jgi:uncharacterized protein YozE (UPF0346 family)
MATNTKQKSTAETSETATKLIPKDIDTSQLIPVYNGFQGRLIYKSVRTHETFVWDTFGDMQEIELRELRSAKSSAKTFFQNNWFMFSDDYAWVIDYLGVKASYKHAISLEQFDDLFKKSSADIEKTVSKLSPGQKKSVAYRARQLILTEEIDSRKTISALEKSLGETLIER